MVRTMKNQTARRKVGEEWWSVVNFLAKRIGFIINLFKGTPYVLYPCAAPPLAATGGGAPGRK
jgi:hypothetical protein